MAFELPQLPYSQDALDPHISAKTLSFHHGKHHAAYVNKLNELIKGGPFEGKDLEEIITRTNLEAVREVALEAGYEWCEYSWILEDNERTKGAVRLMGGELYKIYRMYERAL